MEFEKIAMEPTEDELDELAMFGPRPKYKEGNARFLADAAAKMRDLARRRNAKLKEIRSDHNLTETGKAAARQRFAEEALLELESISVPADSRRAVSEQIAKIRQKLAVGPADPSSAGAAIRQTWLWTRILGIEDALERERLFTEAIGRGDDDLVSAFATIPAALRPIREEVLQEGLAEWANLRNPEEARRLEELQDAMRRHDETLATVRSDLMLAAERGSELIEEDMASAAAKSTGDGPLTN